MEPCIHTEKIGHMEADIGNLIGWQKRQNGSLQRLEEKVNDDLVTKEDLKEVKIEVDKIRDYILYGFLAVIAIQILTNYFKG